MAKRKKSALSPSNAVRFVRALIAEGKIIARDIQRYLEIDALEQRLKALRGVRRPRSQKPQRKRRTKRTVSAEGRASRQLQGKYIAYIRRFPKSGRAKYQTIAKKQGREKAIAAMKKDLTA